MRLAIWPALGLILGVSVAVGVDAQAPAPPPPVAVPAAQAPASAPAGKSSAPVSAPAASAKPAPPVDPWIEQLSSPNFRAREVAVKEIMKIGIPALPALVKAKDRRDAEARRRIDEMIGVLERAAALAPKLITLKIDKKPVRDVLNEMAKQTGFKIPTNDATFNGPQGKALHSFQFDKMPFWEALDRVCEKAGLIMQPNGGDNTLRVSFQDSYEPFKSYDGSFKVSATGFTYNRNSNFGELPKTPYQPGDQSYESLQLSLQICVEPRVPILKVGMVRLSAAEDDNGTSMLANQSNYYDMWNRYYYGGNNRTFIQNATANMAWPSKHSRTVKIIKGVVPVTLLSEQRNVVVTDAIMNSKEKKLKVGNVTFTIESITATNNNKQHEFRITYNEESNDNNYDYSRIQSLQQRLEIHDAKGQKIPAYFRSFSYMSPTSASFTLMTQPAANSKVGPPAKLVFQQWIQMEHEVSFVFKDLPLP
jgi:hypothetical protein